MPQFDPKLTYPINLVRAVNTRKRPYELKHWLLPGRPPFGVMVLKTNNRGSAGFCDSVRDVRRRAMTEMRDWLRDNKLEQIAELFEANEIDFDVLPDLSEADLEKLGLSVGSRKRLLRALAERDVEAAKSTSPGSGAAIDAERRQVTVLFCDMVGSTALSGALDPELLGDVLRRYQNAAAGAVARFGGFVAKFMGDGILAYFGFPHAFEDAAERAVRAALNILVEVGRLVRPDGSPIQVRVGVATGLVVVGEMIGTGPAQERTIVGETPNLAARLQGLAAPDSILISDASRRLLGELFKLEPMGEHELKGIARPAPVWRVLGEEAVESRYGATRARGKLPLIGRGEEMRVILDRWRLARAGEGQIVTVLGEAGIGKSRSVEALQESLGGEPHTRIYLQCSPYHSDSALHPVIQHLGRAARFVAGDSPAIRIEKLSVLFAPRAASDTSMISLAAELMSLPAPMPLALTPAQRRAATIGLLVDEIVGLSETEPVLLIVEDAHWIDATTLELMSRIADSISHARMLVLVTARPEFGPPWSGRSHATLLTFDRLGRTDCLQLVAHVAAAHGLSAETVAAIIAKTDGVPLFIEELTRSVMESAGEGGAAVPATLKDSLMARLDRLGDAREAAQIAAVIGRQFTFSLLASIAPKSAIDLEAALEKLVAAGIVFPEGRSLERSFSFRHALLREAAYESLLLSRRREWHERAGRALEERFADLTANEPELLAHHFGEAGLPAQSCDYRMRAGERAVSRAAYTEAIAHFSMGLKEAEKLPDDAERMRRKLDFLLKLGPALMVTHGMQSAKAEDVYREAEQIGTAAGNDEATFKAKWGQWLTANIAQKSALARDRAQDLVAFARRFGESDLLLEAYHCRWSTALFRGDVKETIENGRVGAETYNIDRHRHLAHAFGGHDPGVCAHGMCAFAYQMSGEAEQAKRHIEKCVALGEALDQPNSLGHALYVRAIVHQAAGDREATLAAARRAVAVAEKFGLGPWRAGSLILVAWATAMGGATADAARLIDAEIENATSAGSAMIYNLALAAEVLLTAGRPGDGIALLDRVFRAIEEPGVGLLLPEAYRMHGECLLAIDRRNKKEARDAFAMARDIAYRQGALVLARRAEASLHRVAQ
jgi:class 3 adenylate cyclase/tetratricopeptide (TPR) repeat protein